MSDEEQQRILRRAVFFLPGEKVGTWFRLLPRERNALTMVRPTAMNALAQCMSGRIGMEILRAHGPDILNMIHQRTGEVT